MKKHSFLSQRYKARLFLPPGASLACWWRRRAGRRGRCGRGWHAEQLAAEWTFDGFSRGNPVHVNELVFGCKGTVNQTRTAGHPGSRRHRFLRRQRLFAGYRRFSRGWHRCSGLRLWHQSFRSRCRRGYGTPVWRSGDESRICHWGPRCNQGRCLLWPCRHSFLNLGWFWRCRDRDLFRSRRKGADWQCWLSWSSDDLWRRRRRNNRRRGTRGRTVRDHRRLTRAQIRRRCPIATVASQWGQVPR